MNSCRDDLLELSDYVWRRLRNRLNGLTDQEYLWEPVPNCRTVRLMSDGRYRSDGHAEVGDDRVFTTLAWRLCHIVDVLHSQRNGPWLGVQAPPARRNGDSGTVAEVMTALELGYDVWRHVVVATTDESLQELIGPVAGPYANSTRRAFVQHILDELIHHGAEAALMRDLYAATPQVRPAAVTGVRPGRGRTHTP